MRKGKKYLNLKRGSSTGFLSVPKKTQTNDESIISLSDDKRLWFW
jgi:hypothetical protein